MRQSIPASYISVTASGGFDIDVYMDLNGQWVTGNSENILEWDMKDLGSDDKARFRSWQIRRQREERFVEYGERAEWGRLHFTGPAVSSPLVHTPHRLTLNRMSASSAAIRAICGGVSPRPALCRTKWRRTIVRSWTMSPSSPFTNPSSSRQSLRRLQAACSTASRTFKTRSRSTLQRGALLICDLFGSRTLARKMR